MHTVGITLAHHIWYSHELQLDKFIVRNRNSRTCFSPFRIVGYAQCEWDPAHNHCIKKWYSLNPNFSHQHDNSILQHTCFTNMLCFFTENWVILPHILRKQPLTNRFPLQLHNYLGDELFFDVVPWLCRWESNTRSDRRWGDGGALKRPMEEWLKCGNQDGLQECARSGAVYLLVSLMWAITPSIDCMASIQGQWPDSQYKRKCTMQRPHHKYHSQKNWNIAVMLSVWFFKRTGRLVWTAVVMVIIGPLEQNFKFVETEIRFRLIFNQVGNDVLHTQNPNQNQQMQEILKQISLVICIDILSLCVWGGSKCCNSTLVICIYICSLCSQGFLEVLSATWCGSWLGALRRILK